MDINAVFIAFFQVFPPVVFYGALALIFLHWFFYGLIVDYML
jgi:hypothetical protein